MVMACNTLLSTLLHLAVGSMSSLFATLCHALQGLVLAMLAMHRHLSKIDVYIASRQESYVASNGVVARVLVVELEALGAHKSSDIHHLGVDIILWHLLNNVAHKLLGILTIVLKHYARLRIV